MQHRKSRYDEKPFSLHNLELNLPDMPEDVQTTWALTNGQDERAESESALADIERQRALREYENTEANLGYAAEAMKSPTAPRNKAELEKRYRAAKHKRDLALTRLNSIKTPAKPERMHTSRIGAALAAIRKKQRHTDYDPPAAYKKSDTLTAIAMVRSEKEARYGRIGELFKALLPMDEAMGRYRISVERMAKDSRMSFRDFATVYEGVGGRFEFESVELPPEILMEACKGFLLAYGENRFQKMYEKIEQQAEFDDGAIEILSMSDRKRERAELEAEIAELHRVEGWLTRKAIMEGHDIAINPDLPVSALLALEDDPDAPVEEAKPQFEEVPGDTSATFAQHVA